MTQIPADTPHAGAATTEQSLSGAIAYRRWFNAAYKWLTEERVRSAIKWSGRNGTILFVRGCACLVTARRAQQDVSHQDTAMQLRRKRAPRRQVRCPGCKGTDVIASSDSVQWEALQSAQWLQSIQRCAVPRPKDQ